MRDKHGVKTLSLNLSVWYDANDGHIHVATQDGDGFISSVGNNAQNLRGHPHLYSKLADALQKAGRAAPET